MSDYSYLILDIKTKNQVFYSIKLLKASTNQFLEKIMNSTKNKSEKAELRRNLIKQRQSVAQNEFRLKSQAICTNLFNSSLFINAKTVLAYFSFRQEPDLSYLFSDDKLN